MYFWVVAVTGHRPVVSGAETVKEAEAVLLHHHLAQLVLQTHGVDVHTLVTQEHCLETGGKKNRNIISRTHLSCSILSRGSRLKREDINLKLQRFALNKPSPLPGPTGPLPVPPPQSVPVPPDALWGTTLHFEAYLPSINIYDMFKKVIKAQEIELLATN